MIYLGLVHHPIRNKFGEIVTTSVTNMDIHDISRSCKTFGVKTFFIITPILKQQILVNRVLNFWKEEKSLVYNPDRYDALKLVKVVDSINSAISQIEENDQKPLVAVTSAKINGSTDASCLKLENRSLLLLFGTGWGLPDEIIDASDFRLHPIVGKSDYNHLSVRSAVAIYLDRIKHLC